jgi:ABC-type multidrug transport system ATPase subunit
VSRYEGASRLKKVTNTTVPNDNASGNAAAGEPLVKISNLTKHYGKTTVLSDFSLEISAGQSIALWGENGAGKTTLLKAMLGLIDVKGDVLIAGLDVRKKGKQTRSKIGYVPQEAVFYDMTVRSTMNFYARLKKVDRSRVSVLLAKLGLSAHQEKLVPALSGGLKQRLALAIALLADPPLLLLDEPTANLDAQARKDYLILLGELRKEGKTVIFASHRIEEAEALADNVVWIEQGIKTGMFTPNEVRVRLNPEAFMTLWIGDGQRQAAMESLIQRGWRAHLNGRGTVVVELTSQEKVQALQHLVDQGFTIRDFEIEGVNTPWN